MEGILSWIENFVDAQLFVSVHVLVIMVHVILLTCAYLIYFERKISAWIQDRIGPNRTGFDFGLPILAWLKGMWGLGQSIADGLKFLVKEDYMPPNADRALFTLAPIAIVIPALIGFAVIPWGGEWIIPDVTLPLVGIATSDLPLIGDITGPVIVAGASVNVGIVYMIAVGSLGVYGVTLGGWAGNNKYSFLGGLRATAQMISYELPMGLCLLAAILIMGTVIPNEIVNYQHEHGWLIFTQPLAAVIFFIAGLAECNRAPFDNAEAEQELVGGYHTEYSSMRFALFFLAEYSHMITTSAFVVLLFLGGWQLNPFGFGPELPIVAEGLGGVGLMLAKCGIFFGKTFLLALFMMVVRWTLPRMRYDQIMFLGWQSLIPISLVIVVGTSVMIFLELGTVVPMLIANVALGAAIIALQPLLPQRSPNRRVAMYGSRFNPIDPGAVRTAPIDPMALEDKPVEGTAAGA